MKIIDDIELMRIKERNKFFDFDILDSDSGWKSRIEFADKDKNITYSDIQFGASIEKVEERAKCLKHLVKELISLFGDYGVISKYNEKWVVDRNQSKLLYDCIKKHNISVRFNGGFLLPDDHMTMLIVDAILRYNCFALFILPGCVLAPSDHMDIFIWYTDSAKRERINDIVYGYNRDKLIVNTQSA